MVLCQIKKRACSWEFERDVLHMQGFADALQVEVSPLCALAYDASVPLALLVAKWLNGTRSWHWMLCRLSLYQSQHVVLPTAS